MSDPTIKTEHLVDANEAAAKLYNDMAATLQAAGMEVDTQAFAEFTGAAVNGGTEGILTGAPQILNRLDLIYGIAFGHGLYVGAMAARRADREEGSRG